MGRYTAAEEFNFSTRESRSVVPDNGVSVTVEFWSGVEWVEDSNSPITEPVKVNARGVKMRLTPDAGGFFIDEGVYY